MFIFFFSIYTYYEYRVEQSTKIRVLLGSGHLPGYHVLYGRDGEAVVLAYEMAWVDLDGDGGARVAVGRGWTEIDGGAGNVAKLDARGAGVNVDVGVCVSRDGDE